jgi:uncharacterized protein YcnI
MPRHNGGSGGSNRKYHQAKRGNRAKSHYADRLVARGMTSAKVQMPTLDSLRKKQLGGAAGVEAWEADEAA